MPKLLTMFLLIPAIFLYAKLIDKLRRYQVLAFNFALVLVF